MRVNITINIQMGETQSEILAFVFNKRRFIVRRAGNIAKRVTEAVDDSQNATFSVFAFSR